MVCEARSFGVIVIAQLARHKSPNCKETTKFCEGEFRQRDALGRAQDTAFCVKSST
ncbi:hypothetical protein MICPUN_54946 [Micromonas commoda]|uniref:Uncharacterized protein n=1 Tax=Micromonas commoda (strain RCC299 / NOUM17 / CCMP2709) TaxID=296587 RepID=C1FD89_MICCC|nr:hypothetical protein MICPUN_54946 [Micromonas commoda]ACO68745.1 hypothetical protein MICPUN_54946 [Micromonas commoda]|eukprot:XP_002507487.1 hypothetical protein MICPUN_54946 [Micromonas commoda]